jgi:hypothetical protein
LRCLCRERVSERDEEEEEEKEEREERGGEVTWREEVRENQERFPLRQPLRG